MNFKLSIYLNIFGVFPHISGASTKGGFWRKWEGGEVESV